MAAIRSLRACLRELQKNPGAPQVECQVESATGHCGCVAVVVAEERHGQDTAVADSVDGVRRCTFDGTRVVVVAAAGESMGEVSRLERSDVFVGERLLAAGALRSSFCGIYVSDSLRPRFLNLPE
jgi:hypothetical protein